MSPIKKFTIEYLNKLLQENNAILVNNDLFNDDNISRHSKIEFMCQCKMIDVKIFRQMEYSGAFCKKCIKISSDIKRKNSNLKKYGVEHTLQYKPIRESIDNTNLKKYGVKCSLLNNSVKEKTKQTNLIKYGTECSTQSLIVRDKISKKNLENSEKNKQVNIKNKNNILHFKYKNKDKASSLQVKTENKILNIKPQYKLDILKEKHIIEKKNKAKEKLKNTNLQRYGVECVLQSNIIKEKIKNTNLQRYGYECSLRSDIVQEKVKKTNLERYGYTNPMQCDEIINKSFTNSHRRKIYISKDGKIFSYMGYENKVLDILLYKLPILSNDIEMDIKYIPKIWYGLENKNKYIPDIFIKSQNKIIEVKSNWTFNQSYEINIEKANACKNQGYKFEFWIFNNNRDKIPTIIII